MEFPWSCASGHYVCVDFLEEVVLGEIRRLTKFASIYEDNVSGKLSDDRFAKMSLRYEDEQKELAEKIKKLRSEIEKQNSGFESITTAWVRLQFPMFCLCPFPM